MPLIMSEYTATPAGTTGDWSALFKTGQLLATPVFVVDHFVAWHADGTVTYIYADPRDPFSADGTTGTIMSMQHLSATLALVETVTRPDYFFFHAFHPSGFTVSSMLALGGWEHLVETMLLGDSVMYGGTGPDYLASGGGDDRYIVDNPGDLVIELLDSGYDTIATSLSSYTLTIGGNIEALAFTGSGLHTGYGNSENNELIGGGDPGDQLYGFDGNDTFSGNGVCIGGAGDDTYRVAASAHIVEEFDGGFDKIYLSDFDFSTYTLPDNVEFLSVGSVIGPSVTIYGSSGYSQIEGGGL